MSKQVDERVVSMQFDNKHFESNVKNTMSTLDKLKEKLNFKSASKGFENVGAAAKKVDMSGMSKGVDTVHAKFSALEVMGVTALANITNSAINAGKKIVKALTVAPVMDGFKEYEMTLNAVQTTMAGTGKTAEEVEQQLKRLDEYADKTVYSTSDMLNNLPKFTNAGVELESATTAMIGIANATALAGGDANKASIAFYNLGQAIGTGYLTRMDYNSINNAGIATMEWKNQMVEAAIAAGTLKKAGEDAYVAGGKTFTLQQLFIDGLQKQWATTDVMMKVFEDYGNEQTEIGKKAYSSAQDIKTFTMMMDSLKATAGTGWKDTWQIIFGGLEEAKVFWTGLSNFISGIITKMDDLRNGILESALGKGFGDLSKKVKGALKPVTATADAVKGITNALKEYDDIVGEILSGVWGIGQNRWDRLAEAGYDWAHAQNLVNEKLGDSTRHATDYAEAAKEVSDAQQKKADASEKLSKADMKTLVILAALSDAELKDKKLKDDQIAALRELVSLSEQLGMPMTELLENLDKINGRWLIIESFKNIGQALTTVFGSMSAAWKEIFTGLNVESIGKGIFNLIAAFYKFSRMLTVTETGAKNLKRTFKGVFAVLDIITTVVAGPIKLAFKIFGQLLSSVFKAFGFTGAGILEFTAYIGDMLVGVRDAVDAIFDFTKVFDKIAPAIRDAVIGFKDWIISLKDSENLPRDIINGLINGIKNGVTAVGEAIVEIGKTIIENIKNVLGIHSPSTVMFDIGTNIIQGLINGILWVMDNLWTIIKGIGTGIYNFFKNLDFNINWAALESIGTAILNFFKNIGSSIVNFIKKIDFGKLLTALVTSGVIYAIKKLYDVVAMFGAPFEGLGDLFEGLGDFLEDVGVGLKKNLKASALKKKSQALLNFAFAIGILAASIYVLAQIDPERLKSTMAALIIFAAVMSLLTIAVGKLGNSALKVSDGVSLGKTALALVGIAGALFIMALAMKKLEFLNESNINQVMTGLGGMIVGLLAILVTCSKLDGINNAGTNILKISAALLLLTFVAKSIAKMEWSEMGKAAAGLGGLMLLIVAFAALTALINKKLGSGADNIGSTVLKMAGSILLLIVAAKMIAGMEWSEMGKAAAGLGGLMLMITIFAGLVAFINHKFGSGADNVGSTILKMAAAIMILVFAAKMLASMEWSEMAKAAVGLVVLAEIINLLVRITQKAGKDAPKIAITLLAMSVAIGVLAAIAVILGWVDLAHLAKGVGAVTMLGLVMAAMIKASQGAERAKGAIIAITVAIGVLTAAVVILSTLDTGKLIGATLALSLVMGMFALIAKMSSAATGSMGTLIVMTVAVGMMAGMIYLLAQLETGAALSASIALSVLMLSMAVVLSILSAIGPTVAFAFFGIVALTALAIPMLAFIGILALMNNIQNATENIKSLIVLMGAMSLLMLPLTLVGSLAPFAFAGVMALTTLALPMLAFIRILALMNNIQNATENASLLITLMESMANVLIKVSILGPLALIGVAAITALSMVMLALGGLVTVLGGLVTAFPSLENFLDKGLDLLAKLAIGLGTIIGNFISGFATAALSGLPEIGLLLSQFMTNAMPFIIGIKMVDEQTLKAVGVLAGVVVALTAANLIEGIASFLSGGESFSRLGTELSNFMLNAMPFIMGASLLTEEMTNGVKNLASTILILTAANVLDGLTSWATGGSSIGSFGEDLALLGAGIATFATSMGTLDKSQLERINIGSEAIKKLAEAAKDIPNEGGWAGAIFGDNSLGSFSEGVVKTGEALRGFVDGIGAFGGGELDTVSNACEAIKKLAEAAKDIPNEGGFWAGLCGDNSLADFSDDLPAIAEDVAEFANKAGDADADKAKRAVDMVTALTGLADVGIGNVGSNLEEFGAKVASFAGKIGDFCSIMGSISQEAITTSTTKLTEFVNTISQIANTEIGSLQTFGESLKTAGVDGVKAFIGAFTDGSMKSQLTKAADALVKSAVDKIKSQSNYNKFKSAGKYLVEGFCAGISENTYMVRAKAQDMAQAAVDAANAKLDVNSPSRVFMKTGASVVEGFVKGLTNNTGDAETSARNLGNAVLKATQNELKINSPSLVFEEKVGRWIVKGIAKGIEKETSAEKAASEKANAIVEAFNKEITKYSVAGDIAEGTLQLWKKVDGKNATRDEIADKDEEFLKGELERAKTRKKLYADQVYALKEQVNSTKDSKAKAIYQESLRDAEKNFIDAQNEEADIYAQLQETADSRITNKIEAIDRVREYEDAELSKWLETEGLTASDEMVDDVYRNYYDRKGQDLAAKAALLTEAYGQAMLNNGPDSDAVHDAYMAIVDNDAKIRENENNKIALDKSATRRQIDDLEELQKDYDNAHDHWLAAFESTVSEKEVDARTIASLERDNTLIDKKIELETEYLNKFELGSKEYKETTDRILEYEREKTDNLNSIKEIKRRELDYIEDIRSDRKDEHDLWLDVYGTSASELEVEGRTKAYLNNDNKLLDDLISSEKEYLKTVEEGSKEYKESTDRIFNWERQKAANNKELQNIRRDVISDLEEAIAAKEKEHNLWDAMNPKADEDLLDDRDISLLKWSNDRYQELIVEQVAVLNSVAEGSAEAKEATDKILDYRTKIAENENKIVDIEKSGIQRRRDELRTQYSLAMEVEDLKYQIWEKTAGRKATSNEKDAYKVSILSRQLVYETKTLEIARDEWEDAVEEYGKSSNEANEAYNKYLQKQLDIATMQSDITNITEKSAERQRIAQSEYKKYVEKYKKYYLKNGMTLEDLERDAKLVTGYDSTNTTPQSIISKTAEALEDVLDSSEYQKVLDTFGTIGTSYVTAVKDGATAQAGAAVSAVIELSANCITVLKETKSMWVEAGKHVASGFAKGISDNVGVIVSAAYMVSRAAVEAMRLTLDINSPSKVSEEIGKFTVLGFANGLVNNTNLVSGAASELTNATIDNLRNSIRRVTEAIENDVDTQPTIRPVLDLSDVEAGAARIGGMFSRSQAIRISNGMNTTADDVNQNGGSSGGNTYQFTQNNYSPKALSRREIYRQTKNQFAAMKGATT